MCICCHCLHPHLGGQRGEGVSSSSVWTKAGSSFSSSQISASLALRRLLEKLGLAWYDHDVWALRAVSFSPTPKKDYSSDIWIARVSCVWAQRKWFPSNGRLWKPLSTQSFSLLCVFSVACWLSANGQRGCTCSELGRSVKLQQLSFTKSKGPVPLLVKLPHEIWRLFCPWLDRNYLRSYFLFCFSNFDQKWKILRHLKTILTVFFFLKTVVVALFFFKELNLLRESLFFFLKSPFSPHSHFVFPQRPYKFFSPCIC